MYIFPLSYIEFLGETKVTALSTKADLTFTPNAAPPVLRNHLPHRETPTSTISCTTQCLLRSHTEAITTFILVRGPAQLRIYLRMYTRF